MTTKKQEAAEPDLKSGLSSTTFWGKTIAEVLLVANAILHASGKTSLKVSPEMSAALATLLELAYMSWRHYNRSVVNKAKAEIEESKSKAVVAKAEAVRRKKLR